MSPEGVSAREQTTLSVRPKDMASKPKRRIGRLTLVAVGILLALLIALYTVTRATEEGSLGAHAQTWLRIEKSRFTFNRVYSMSTPPFEQAPSAFLARSVENMPPGAALDIAAGQGRNSLHLARKGWRVTAFDISENGLEVARRNAAQSGVQLETLRRSAQDFDFGRERWDLVILIYAPIPFEDAGLMARIRGSVKPGGLVLVDNPVVMHGPASAVPRVPGDLKPGELPTLFPGFEILEYTEAEDITDWFRLKMPMGRLLARKAA